MMSKLPYVELLVLVVVQHHRRLPRRKARRLKNRSQHPIASTNQHPIDKHGHLLEWDTRHERGGM